MDDEPLARRVLEKYIDTLPSLELVKQCSNAMEAAAYLHTHSVDVMFLDIKMPELTGLDFLKTLAHPPQIILTTAYSEYALEGYEYSVKDYLLKPISFERFLKAINKITPKILSPISNNAEQNRSKKDEFIFLRADKIDHKISFSDIQYIEGCGNFIKVYTDDKMLMVSVTMANIENSLPSDRFIRTHKSYIVSLHRIDQVEGNMIRMGDKTIPIGNQYKMTVRQILQRFQLGNS